MDEIAVVIPAYNCEDCIRSTLESINSQTAVKNIKSIIVVDDGSTDDTYLKIVSYKKESRIPLQVIHKANGRVSTARNLGVQNAGDVKWIAFCDADDIWKSNKIERQLEVLQDNEQIDALGGDFDDKGLRILGKKIEELHKGNVKEILIQNYPQPSTVIIKKKIFDAIGGFDEKQKYAEDGNFFLKVAQKYNLYYLPEKLIEYGAGKRGFGVKGLSANLRGMYEGNIKNIREMRKAHYISSLYYYFIYLLQVLKYFRRIVITMINHEQ